MTTAKAADVWRAFRRGLVAAAGTLTVELDKVIRHDPGRPGAWVDALPWGDVEDALIVVWQQSAVPAVRAAIRRAAKLGKTRAIHKDTRRGAASLATSIGTEDVTPEEVQPYRPEEIPLTTAERMALAWIETHGLELAEGLTREAQDAIKAILTTGFREGWDVRRMAARVRQAIGLDKRWAGAVLRFAADLERQGWAGNELTRRVSAYRRRLLQARAERIVRTETIGAANAGSLESWKALQSAGELPAFAQKVWVAAESDLTCAVCRGLDALPPRELAAPYQLPRGKTVERPPAHPNCRCALGLA